METRYSNIKIWEDTYNLVENGVFSRTAFAPSTKLSFDDLPCDSTALSSTSCTNSHNPTIEIINEDTFTCAQKIVRLGFDPLILNMASDSTPGGGVRKGAFAQEENLFRRSDYYKFLPKELYPILPNEVIYSPNVLVFKDKNYKLLTHPFEVACIACAGIRQPRRQLVIGSDGEKKEIFHNNEDWILTREKIRALFKVAHLYGHDSLVLGALGCGAFCNPPETVAQIFNEVLTEYKHHFKYICFAIYSIDDPNYDIFTKYIHL